MDLFIEINLSLKLKQVGKLLSSFNRKARDKFDKRYFFVPNPIKLQINNIPMKSVTLKHHPTENLDNSFEFLTDSLTTLSGIAESQCKNLSEGDMIQFNRIGFCRVISNQSAILSHK